MTIRAIYKNGVLRPIKPLDLPEGCEVALEVQSVSDESNLDAIYQVLSQQCDAGQNDVAKQYGGHQP